MKPSPEQILDLLEIASGDTLFIKASRHRLGYDVNQTRQLLELLCERIGPEGTMVMPSFPWKNEEAFLPDGFEFDVRRTPSRMGLLSELFRTKEGTARSEHYWWPLCARGRHAQEILAGQRFVVHPFGPGSSPRRLLDFPTKMVGLGVTTNYNIITHVVDAALEPRYPRKLFTTRPMSGYVIDVAGERHPMHTVTVPQEVRAVVKPSRLITKSPLLLELLKESVCEGTIFWSLAALPYYTESLRLGSEALEKGQWPPWLEGLD